MDLSCAPARPATLDRLRHATRSAHDRLEHRANALDRLADPALRPDLVRRYADFHMPADGALAPLLHDVRGLDFQARNRTTWLADRSDRSPAFPRPSTRSEALGMLYVLEGSTLGGRLILRELAKRGVVDETLRFLDPYGSETGRRWRDFIAVLERETAVDETSRDEAEAGALRGFAHAETVLCEAAA